MKCNHNYFAGIHLIPTVNMYEPSSPRKVRDIDTRYINSLKVKAIVCPTLHVALLLANINPGPKFEFDSKKLDKYRFEMIGGNHSREVFQSLIVVCKILSTMAVYRGKETLTLGKQHNMAAGAHLQSKFRDDVKLTRRLFMEIEQPLEDQIMIFNEAMRSVFMKVFGIEVMLQ